MQVELCGNCSGNRIPGQRDEPRSGFTQTPERKRFPRTLADVMVREIAAEFREYFRGVVMLAFADAARSDNEVDA